MGRVRMLLLCPEERSCRPIEGVKQWRVQKRGRCALGRGQLERGAANTRCVVAQLCPKPTRNTLAGLFQWVMSAAGEEKDSCLGIGADRWWDHLYPKQEKSFYEGGIWACVDKGGACQGYQVSCGQVDALAEKSDLKPKPQLCHNFSYFFKKAIFHLPILGGGWECSIQAECCRRELANNLRATEKISTRPWKSLFSLSERRSRGDLITVPKCRQQKKTPVSKELFNLSEKARTRASGWEMKADKCK